MGAVFILLFVLASNTLFVQSKVSPQFAGCTQYFYKGIRPTNLPEDTQICQDKNGKMSSIFATSYDTTKKIPIYSAYILDLNGGTCPRTNSWYTENDLTKSKQAQTKDYLNSGFDRGHLSPNCYIAPGDRAATFALTNAVPQYPTFNQKGWKKAEQDARDIMKRFCNGGVPYFITGAIPGNKVLNAGVNIPSFMYTAACCASTMEKSFSFGYIGPNEKNGMIQDMNIVQLGQTVQKLYQPPIRNVEFFADNCYYNNTMSKKILQQLKSITALKNRK